MARKRTPSPEQQTSDRTQVSGCILVLSALEMRYPAQLRSALVLLRDFAGSKVEAPAKRKASTKAPAMFDAEHVMPSSRQ